jgi:hypothetical protein
VNSYYSVPFLFLQGFGVFFMSRKLLKIKYKENFTLTSSSNVYLATISKTLYVCIRGWETISYSTFSLYMPIIEMLLHTVTLESVLEIGDVNIRHI